MEWQPTASSDRIRRFGARVAAAVIVAAMTVSCAGGGSSDAGENESMLCVGKYYTRREAGRVLARLREQYTTEAQWRRRAELIRTGILRGAGLDPLPARGPLNAVVHSRRVHNDYQVENVAFESLPGVWVTGSLYRPVGDGRGPLAGVLSPHGHWSDPDDHGRYNKAVQHTCATLARMGALVLAWDMVGFGEQRRFGWTHRHPETLKLQLWNSIRAVDFLLEVGADPGRLAVTGASGGATQAILLTAVDERIAVSAPVNQVSAHNFGGCPCESGMPIHRSRHHITNNVEIAALAAPRPMLIVSEVCDWTNRTPWIEFPHIRYIYKLSGHADRVENRHVFCLKHGYPRRARQAVYEFLARRLDLDAGRGVGPDGRVDESGNVIEAEPELYFFDGRHPYPDDAARGVDEVKWPVAAP